MKCSPHLFSECIERELSSVVKEMAYKVYSNQKVARKPLLDCIFDIVKGNKNALRAAITLPKEGLSDEVFIERVFNELTDTEEAKSARNMRKNILKLKGLIPNESSYLGLVKALYPTNNEVLENLNSKSVWLQRLRSSGSKYFSINHDLVFRKYRELPRPGILYMEPYLLEDFLAKMFYYRGYVRPNAFSKNYDRSISTMKKMYKGMLQKRRSYWKMCTNIISDLNSVGIRLSLHERNQMIFYSYFRDKEEIIKKIKDLGLPSRNGNASEGYFSIRVYESLKKQFMEENGGLTIETYNNFLFLASRHGNHELVSIILEELNFNYAKGKKVPSKNEAFNTVVPNRRTVDILLEYYTTENYISSKHGSLQELRDLLNLILKSETITPDILMLNSIIRALLKLNLPEGPQFLLGLLFLNYDQSSLKNTLIEKINSSPCFYALRTTDDKLYYKKLMNLYDKLGDILSLKEGYNYPPFTIFPTETTFRLFIDYHCSQQGESGSFDNVSYILKVMGAQYNMPITTRIFTQLYRKFLKENQNCISAHGWDLKSLNYITSMLLNEHDRLYSKNSDISLRDNLRAMGLSSELESFALDHIKGPSVPSPDESKGNFLKFSDGFITNIYEAYISVIDFSNDIGSQRKREIISSLESRKVALFDEITEIRSKIMSHSPSERKRLSMNDEIIFLKKNFVLEILFIASQS